MSNTYLIILLSCFVFASPQPYKIDIHMQSLCAGCRLFIKEQLKPFMEIEGYETLAQINFIPFGNAKETQVGDVYSFKCQYGERECYGNLIYTCVLHHFDHLRANEFILCVEDNFHGNFDKTTERCVETNDELDQIQACLSDPQLNLWQHQIAKKTLELSPPHMWVPWIIVNGEYDADIIEKDDILAYLCRKLGEERVSYPICRRKHKINNDDDGNRLLQGKDNKCLRE